MSSTDERYKLLEELRHNVFNYIRGMKPEQLAREKRKNGWYHWIDDALTKIDLYDANRSIAGLSKLVGDAKPGPTSTPKTLKLNSNDGPRND